MVSIVSGRKRSLGTLQITTIETSVDVKRIVKAHTSGKWLLVIRIAVYNLETTRLNRKTERRNCKFIYDEEITGF